MANKQDNWPRVKCDKCGDNIKLVNVGGGRMVPYELSPHVPHVCGDVLDRSRSSPGRKPSEHDHSPPKPTRYRNSDGEF